MTGPVTAIGCRVKSGWAMTVLLAGPASTPRVLDRRRIELSDPAIPETVQPYHAGFGTEQTDARAVRRLTRIVTRCAKQSLAGLVRAYHAMGVRPRLIGLVVGSTVDPASIGNQHIRAHAQEGRLFRTVIEAAAAVAAWLLLASRRRLRAGSDQLPEDVTIGRLAVPLPASRQAINDAGGLIPYTRQRLVATR